VRVAKSSASGGRFIVTPGAPNPYEIGLETNAANFVPLTPLGFLSRSASVFPDRGAVVYGERRYSWRWRQTYQRCRRLAGALAAHGVRHGDTVAVMIPNDIDDAVHRVGAVQCMPGTTNGIIESCGEIAFLTELETELLYSNLKRSESCIVIKLGETVFGQAGGRMSAIFAVRSGNVICPA